MLPPVHRHTQLAMLREIAREMEQLTSDIEAIGAVVQVEAIPYVYAFFDLADMMIQEESAGFCYRIGKCSHICNYI